MLKTKEVYIAVLPGDIFEVRSGGCCWVPPAARETAARVGETRSNGCMRADGWARLPLIRMTNVSLEAGRQTLEEVFDADHAIYMETNRSWSIDDKRYNFQFGCEIGWEIRNGTRVRMLKNPSYSGISTEFWNACAAIAGPVEP